MPERNRLAGETSPYLQQHRDNPVHWWPWGKEALDTALSENKPILLSVGYSACHWCHVMAHECFEDEDVAAVMNELYVNIKVDREERPDIDQIFMAALHATGEQGGWPLTMFLTPDAKPFWGGTYFPKNPRYGRPGFIQVMQSVHKAWKERPDDIISGSVNLTEHVKRQLSSDSAADDLSAKPLIEMGNRIAQLIDPVLGGIKGAPKFPNAPYMTTLWLSAVEQKNADHQKLVIDSLAKMLSGGIYDHVGGGLCRYSTDERWTIPHFEKMLYDNAQMIEMCVFAHGATGSGLFRQRIEETIDWLEREMVVSSGAYASSLDADSEGEEGKFYLWTEAEIRALFGAESQKFFNEFDLLSPPGWEGEPVIARRKTADHHLQDLISKLLVKRDERVRPGRDDKALTDWNGLATSAIAQASRHFGNQHWGEIASRLYHAVKSSQDPSGRLPHSVNGPSKLFPALSTDYAAMINAAVSLFELSSDSIFIEDARIWSKILADDYGDGDGGHFLTSQHAVDVPIRIRGDLDEAILSATSQITQALSRLAVVTADPHLHEQAIQCASLALGRAKNQSHGQAGIFNAAYLALNASKLVIVDEPQNSPMWETASSMPDPRRVDIRISTGSDAQADKILTEAGFDTTAVGAWLCKGQSCFPPVRTPADLDALLREEYPSIPAA